MTHRNIYLNWLKDAYAMEKEIEKVLEAHAEDAKGYPRLQFRIRQHLDITRTQSERLGLLIELNGGDVSNLRTGVGKLMGMMSRLTTEFAADKLIKNAQAEYAAKNFEIASYYSLISAAERAGDIESVDTFEQIIREETAMASWLAELLPAITQEMMEKAA